MKPLAWWPVLLTICVMLACVTLTALGRARTERFALQQHFSLYKHVITEKEAKTLARTILRHTYLTENPLHPTTFDGTRGFALHFTSDAAEALFADDERLHPFAKTFVTLYELLGERGNAFVFNVLVCPASEAGIDWHRDDTLDLQQAEDTPSAIAVLYVQMPAEGGECELCTRPDAELGEGGPTARDTVIVSPGPGDALVFEGGLAHRVHPHDSDTPRVSITLEAYDLPDTDTPLPSKKAVGGED